MKKLFFSLLSAGLLLTGCADSSSNKSDEPKKSEAKKEEPKKAEVKKEESKKAEAKTDDQKINTSVYRYAKKVDITDARSTNKHINVVVHMDPSLTKPLAVQHVMTQTYDFLQQPDIKGAKTVTVGVMQGDERIFQITTDLKKFKTNDKIPMMKLVLDASKVEKTRPEIDQYIQEIINQ